ncbi:ureidoglycolate lyase [Ferrovibrio terrae]|uniref:ureidoglycolate lyase n=1 Tax=Ferrovibrio terrae TaxID=2594003 RepID=UPI0031380046
MPGEANIVSSGKPISVDAITPEAFAPFGWMLGKPFPVTESAVAYGTACNGFWHEHIFDPGMGGEHEVLWVTYNVSDRTVDRLELHRLTQQAVVPLVGSIIQVVALSDAAGKPDLATVKAFMLSPGVGICMQPNIWHATRTTGSDATCLMLTRRSTTADLVDHLTRDAPATETRLLDIDRLRLSR